LRILEFGCQMLEKEMIYDMSKANSMKAKLEAVNAEDWQSHMKVFEPMYEELKMRFKELKNKVDV